MSRTLRRGAERRARERAARLADYERSWLERGVIKRPAPHEARPWLWRQAR